MFRAIVQKVSTLIVSGLIFLIRCYQLLVSSWTRSHCRFYPTCSAYAKEALKQHGLFRGLYFTLNRLLRCHPFHSGGYDPIPKERLKTHGH